VTKPNPKASRRPPYDYNHRWRSPVTAASLAAEYAELYERLHDPTDTGLPGGSAFLVDDSGASIIDVDGAYFIEG
jgi:hypothetical protein